VKSLLSAIPLADLDSILTVHGTEIPLETNAKADAGGLARHFERFKAAT
jgi:hypothetical protein